MNIEILIKENDILLPYDKSKLLYHTLENELGEYFDLRGEIIFNIESETIKIKTETLENDIYTLFYSINDFIELNFVSTMFNQNKISLEYSRIDVKTLQLQIDESKVIIDTHLFLQSVLKASNNFFKVLQKNNSSDDNEYKMYLGIIDSLQRKLKLK